jgi:hypothetical protein
VTVSTPRLGLRPRRHNRHARRYDGSMPVPTERGPTSKLPGAPGGVGSGLCGMLITAVIAVFIAGLMGGRTSEYPGKRIGTRGIKPAACYVLVTPAVVLVFTAATKALPTPPTR